MTATKSRAAYNCAWRKSHPEKVRRYKADYYAKHREQVRRSNDAWFAKNPDKARAMRAKTNAAAIARYKASKLRATPSWANHFFIEEAYHLAQLRTKATGFKWHVDHIVPLQSKRVCGLHVENNLAVIPALANQSKGNRHWPGLGENSWIGAQ